MIRVVLADDHALLREGLRLILESESDIQVVAEAGDGSEALRRIVAERPDVVVLDLEMPVMGGLDVLRELSLRGGSARVIVLSMHDSLRHIRDAVRSGARAYLPKGTVGCELLTAVRAVHAGQRYFAVDVADRLADVLLSPAQSDALLDSLSERERQVLQMVVEGKSSAEIGRLLFLSPKTVDTYRSRLMQKLGIDDIPGLVRYAVRQGLIPLE
ncbi:response regulator [Parachitinimonas caeni]|uniref:Response regulator transcription factor n=1 Tax=Parachitinimonas caeni TaxID=3031301 RepID=A0ABT7DVU0_9NEIS|nr:response regulator transcription factor [Parachitinimonas caeni]MDK2122772.1 response regulator transcription factor [Parachitinimonas caeni]